MQEEQLLDIELKQEELEELLRDLPHIIKELEDHTGKNTGVW